MAPPKKKPTTKKTSGRATPVGTRPPAKPKAKAEDKSGRLAVLEINGVQYELNEFDMRPKDVADLRKATGMGFGRLFELLQTDPDIDIVAALLWIIRRQNGEPRLTLEEAQDGIGYDMEVKLINASEDDDNPEV